jgi:hypothetical protein
MRKSYWPHANIELITNGLLIPSVSKETLLSIKDEQIGLIVSQHFHDIEFNKRFYQGIQVLRELGIPHEIRPSYLQWAKAYRKDADGSIHPYYSDSEKAWQNCGTKNQCITLMNNQLHKCPQLACISHAIHEGFLSDEWREAIMGYQPLTPDCTRDEIAQFLMVQSIPQCKICCDRYESASPYEKFNFFGNQKFEVFHVS